MSRLLISRRQALIAAAAAAGGAFGLADLAHSATTDAAAGGPLRVGYLPITDAAQLLLRVSLRSPGAVCDLSRKFGCDPEGVLELARLAA